MAARRRRERRRAARPERCNRNSVPRHANRSACGTPCGLHETSYEARLLPSAALLDCRLQVRRWKKLPRAGGDNSGGSDVLASLAARGRRHGQELRLSGGSPGVFEPCGVCVCASRPVYVRNAESGEAGCCLRGPGAGAPARQRQDSLGSRLWAALAGAVNGSCLRARGGITHAVGWLWSAASAPERG